MAIQKRGQAYIAAFMVQGTRFHRSFDTPKAAKSWEAEARSALAAGEDPKLVRERMHKAEVDEVQIQLSTPLPTKREDGITVAHAFRMVANDYQFQKDGKRSLVIANEVRQYFGNDTLLRNITPALRDEFIQYLRTERGLTPASVNRKLAALSKMFKKAREYEPLSLNIHRFKESDGRTKVYSKAEEAAILDAALKFHGEVWWRYLVIAFETGMRAGEIQKMRSSWLHEASGGRWQLVVGGRYSKGSTTRTIDLTSRAVQAIKEQLKDQWESFWPPSVLTRTAPSKVFARIRKALRKEDDDDFVLHAVRHTAATRLLEGTGNLVLVKNWLGHANVTTTERYAKLTTVMLRGGREALEARGQGTSAAVPAEILLQKPAVNSAVITASHPF